MKGNSDPIVEFKPNIGESSEFGIEREGGGGRESVGPCPCGGREPVTVGFRLRHLLVTILITIIIIILHKVL